MERSFIPPSAPKQQRVLPDADTHVARLYSLVDLGTVQATGQFAKDKDGNQRFKRELLLTWELPEATHVFKEENGPEPFVVGKTFTFSLGEKANLRKALNSWRGKDLTDEEAAKFDIQILLGQPCLLTIGHQTSGAGITYANIMGIVKLPKNTKCPPAINPPVSYHIGDGEGGNYSKLPEWIQKKIQQSEEWQHRDKSKPAAKSDNDPWTDETAADEMAAKLERKAVVTDEDDVSF